MTAPTSPLLSSIPMGGVECGRCGFPALAVEIGPIGRHIVHLDSRLPPCAEPNPERTVA